MHRKTLHKPHKVKTTFRSICALLLREIATTYGRTPGGYLWAILEPVAGITLISFVFSIAFHAPPLGSNFALFYATGILPYMLYVHINTRVMGAIGSAKPLLQYPAVSFIDAIMSRVLLALLTQIIVFYLVISVLLILFSPQIGLDMSKIVLSLAMAAMLGAGLGVLNCFIVSALPIWQRVWNVLHRPMFIISGILYIFETVPQPYREYLWFNPLVHVIAIMRSGFYPTYDAVFVSPAYVFALGLIPLALGLFFLRRWHKDFVYA